MATEIGSTGLTFETSNMKPESKEQIDALWGQNIGDNLGWLRAKKENLLSLELMVTTAIGQRTGTKWIAVNQPYGTLKGTLFATCYSAAGVENVFALSIGADTITDTTKWQASKEVVIEHTTSYDHGSIIPVVYTVLVDTGNEALFNISLWSEI